MANLGRLIRVTVTFQLSKNCVFLRKGKQRTPGTETRPLASRQHRLAWFAGRNQDDIQWLVCLLPKWTCWLLTVTIGATSRLPIQRLETQTHGFLRYGFGNQSTCQSLKSSIQVDFDQLVRGYLSNLAFVDWVWGTMEQLASLQELKKWLKNDWVQKSLKLSVVAELEENNDFLSRQRSWQGCPH